MPTRRVRRRVRTGRKFVRTGYQKRMKVFISKRYRPETDMTYHTVRVSETLTLDFTNVTDVVKA